MPRPLIWTGHFSALQGKRIPPSACADGGSLVIDRSKDKTSVKAIGAASLLPSAAGGEAGEGEEGKRGRGGLGNGGSGNNGTVEANSTNTES